MFPIGIRIWDQGKMTYPVKFSVYLDIEKNISFIKTMIEGRKYQTFNYMMLAPVIAINGYVYEKDIIMIDGEDSKTGVVLYDKKEGCFTVSTKSGKIIINESLEFCEILGNVYEDENVLKEMKIFYKDQTVTENFMDTSTDEDEVVKKEVVTKETTPEIKKDNFKEPEKKAEPVVKKDDKPKQEEKAPEDKKKDQEPPWRKDKKEEAPVAGTSPAPAVDKEEKKEEKKSKPAAEIETIDSNLILGADDLPYLDDDEVFDEPIDEGILDDVDVIGEMEVGSEPAEELPPDNMFGSETEAAPVKKESKPAKVKTSRGVIYAVGYCTENKSPGSYSYIIEDEKGKQTKNSGGLKETDTNEVQLVSVIEALKNIEGCKALKIYSDSKYVIFPFVKGWIYKWQANDWKKDSGTKVSGLWEEIYNLTKDMGIQWEYVANISSIPQITECVESAKKEISKYI